MELHLAERASVGTLLYPLQHIGDLFPKQGSSSAFFADLHMPIQPCFGRELIITDVTMEHVIFPSHQGTMFYTLMFSQLALNTKNYYVNSGKYTVYKYRWN